MIVPTLKLAICSAMCAAVQSFSGSVTLKYAFVECVSNGPGGSIEASVVARINGGVSSSVGSTSLGIVMM